MENNILLKQHTLRELHDLLIKDGAIISNKIKDYTPYQKEILKSFIDTYKLKSYNSNELSDFYQSLNPNDKEYTMFYYHWLKIGPN